MKKEISKFKDKYRKFEEDYSIERKIHADEVKEKAELLKKQHK